MANGELAMRVLPSPALRAVVCTHLPPVAVSTACTRFLSAGRSSLSPRGRGCRALARRERGTNLVESKVTANKRAFAKSQRGQQTVIKGRVWRELRAQALRG